MGISAALLGAVALLALAGCSVSDDAATGSPADEVATTVSALEEALQHGFEITPATGSDENQAPEFAGVTKWLNSSPLTMTGLLGQVVLVDFWTYT